MNSRRLSRLWLVLLAAVLCAEGSHAADAPVDFIKDIQPIFAKNCLSCHGEKKQKGSLRLDVKSVALRTGEHQVIVPGKSAASKLIALVTSTDDEKVMPPDGERLTAPQIAWLKAWIDQGAVWPESAANAAALDKLNWWSLKPVTKPAVPAVADGNKGWAKTPVDAFVLAKLGEKKLSASPTAEKRVLLRRVYFDLIGLPPTPEELDAFVADKTADAYEKIVDKLLASPRYGERWARHWLDTVHFAETHGHDQDRVRENAWPYRDYLIEAFNRDTPYARFVQEQLAADVLFEDEPRLTPALGFIAAGPWDESSLRDIREDSLCRKVGYYIDRDDMVTQTMGTFASATVHCARCHDHKFDPISQQDYYALQAVFAGIGRADRAYDADAETLHKRRALNEKLRTVERKDSAIDGLVTPDLVEEIKRKAAEKRGAEWAVAEIDLAEAKSGAVLTREKDGALLATGATPETDTYTIKMKMPRATITGLKLEVLSDESLPHKGPGRQPENGNLHLSEFKVKAEAKEVAIARATADFNQSGWTIAHAIDGKMETAWGIHPEEGKAHWAVFEFKEPVKDAATLTADIEQQHGRKHVIGKLRLSWTSAPHPSTGEFPAAIEKLLSKPFESLDETQRRELAAHSLKQRTEKELAALPPQKFVYAGAAEFKADGSHKPVATPREVMVLRRGEILKPENAAAPGALGCVPALANRFDLKGATNEGARRAALARWLSDPRNPLTWRSIVNRVWHYHFGRGLVNTPNDFGRMGTQPTHPELLDWLAADFLEQGGSLKKLQRLIVTSAVYRQSSRNNPAYAAVDGDNAFLWRMNAARLDAESLHDAILQFSGKLDLTAGGPSVRQFSLSVGIHVTPNIDYAKYDWNSQDAGRRAIYRFIFRTLPDPFMDALDCADASLFTPARNVSLSPLQALALMNDAYMLKQCEFFAGRLKRAAADGAGQVRMLYRLALLREPTRAELEAMVNYAGKFGLENACRVMLNCNEFMFVE